MKQINAYIFFCVAFLSIGSCSGQKNSGRAERVEKLGIEIFKFVQNGDYEAQLPEDLVFIGNNTFWKILEITEPVDSIKFLVHDATEIDDKADYLLDFSTYIGLRIKYDNELDKFHILGFQGTQTKTEESLQKKIFDLDQKLYKVGKIRPNIGLDGMIINESTRNEIFCEHPETIYNKLGVWFDFRDDTLTNLYISKFQLMTEKGIRAQTSSKSKILKEYGTPNSTKENFTFLNKEIKNIELLEYEGIEFVLLKDELMLILVN